MKDLTDKGYQLLREWHFSHDAALYTNLFLGLGIICITAILLDIFSKKLLVLAMGIVAKRTKTSFDDFLVENKTSAYVAHLVPLYFIANAAPIALRNFTYWEFIFNKGLTTCAILLTLWIIRSVFNSLRDYLKQLPGYNDKPIDSYIQVIMIVLWIFGITAIILIIFDVSSTALLSTFGAISAIILLIFRDTILGFVASIQVSVNDLVRIGDWITIDKYGADGYVIEINLATVKVRNFDNTISTVPTYSLISDSLRNWRGMLDSEGRRIKRSLLIKAGSVRFVHSEELESLKEIQLLSSYIDQRQEKIDKFNMRNNIDKSVPINGRNLTNLGLFRKYINEYLQHHPGVNKDMTIMCRHLQPNEKGIPIEIYVFTKDKRWINHEYIMADIFDHIIAAVPYFDLEVFELPSGSAFVEP